MKTSSTKLSLLTLAFIGSFMSRVHADVNFLPKDLYEDQTSESQSTPAPISPAASLPTPVNPSQDVNPAAIEAPAPEANPVAQRPVTPPAVTPAPEAKAAQEAPTQEAVAPAPVEKLTEQAAAAGSVASQTIAQPAPQEAVSKLTENGNKTVEGSQTYTQRFVEMVKAAGKKTSDAFKSAGEKISNGTQSAGNAAKTATSFAYDKTFGNIPFCALSDDHVYTKAVIVITASALTAYTAYYLYKQYTAPKKPDVKSLSSSYKR